MSAIHSFFHCLEVEETSINAASLFVKIAFRVGKIIIGEKHLCPLEFCCLPYLICVEPCTSCVCVVSFDMASLQSQRKEVKGLGWLVGPCRKISRSKSVLSDGCRLEGRTDSLHFPGGHSRKTGLRGSCTFSLTRSWSALWAVFVFRITGSITQPAAVLQCEPKIEHYKNWHCTHSSDTFAVWKGIDQLDCENFTDSQDLNRCWYAF